MNIGWPSLNFGTDADSIWVQFEDVLSVQFEDVLSTHEWIDGELWEKGITPRPENE